MNHLPDLPTAATYAKAAHQLDAELRRPPSMPHRLRYYLLHTEAGARGTQRYMAQMARLGTCIEAYDRTTGLVDETRTTTKAFTDGSTAGLMLARNIHGELAEGNNMLDILRETTKLPHDDEPEHMKHLLAEEIIDLAGRGVAQLGEETEAVIEGWEALCVPDVTKQIMFRRGVGLTALLAYRVHEAADFKMFAQQVNAAEGFDWNAALREMGETS